MTEKFTHAKSGGITRILLVDDHNDLLTMLELVLSRRDFDVATATSGAEALAKAGDFAPHVVVSDLGMPGMNGLEMMEQLRQMNGIGPFKAIALSGFDDASDAEQAISAGFDAHLAKPIDFEHLFATIDRLMD
jgi:two-component system, chemotaxis family, CheB/CheR fusion protein